MCIRDRFRTMKNLKLLFILIFWGFVFTVIPAQIQDLNKPIPADPNIKIGKLENGLTSYIKFNKKPEHRVELYFLIISGSLCVTDGQHLLAHFFVYICFNGTKN